MPHISLSTWWVVAAVGAVAFSTSVASIVATRQDKIKACIGPIAGAAFLALYGVIKGQGIETLLPMYAIIIWACPAGAVGRRQEIKRKMLDKSQHGERPENQLSLGANIQFLVVVLLFAILAVAHTVA
ncbi:hypothetical protein ACFZB9_19425 [Kitasatospora sp. NPDC008050]|uniref:hypothetical protein n=1 Tax=Kitasatospora sp. NPDC008050 TaxID=3364021 RepID=UPI0036EC67D7